MWARPGPTPPGAASFVVVVTLLKIKNEFHFLLASSLQEFEIIMVKQQGSLGFTLRKEDDSVLGHYVRALVRKPATDGIIKPGDKIVAVSWRVRGGGTWWLV